MKTALSLLLLSVLVAVSHASDADALYDEQDRDLHRGGRFRGGRGRGDRPDPEVLLTCADPDVVPCTGCGGRRRHGFTTNGGSGIYVCLQHPEDATRNKTKCMEANESNQVMVFSSDDTCGCCDGSCPDPCDTCPCDGGTGYEMLVTRGRRHWWSDQTPSSVCVPVNATVDVQLREGSCVSDCTLDN